MVGYAAKVKRDIGRWVSLGLIDDATASRLVADVDASPRNRVRIGTIFAMMAAALLSAAILIFVAANWEAIPRLARAVMLSGLILGGFLGGALLKIRGHAAFGEAAWIVGAASFGASIALIGQMYHLTGDETAAILTWLGGTALAAALLRSAPLTIASVILSAVWLCLKVPTSSSFGQLPHGWLLIGAAIWLLSYWTRSAASRHLLAFVLLGYAIAVEVTVWKTAVPHLTAAAGIALFALAKLDPARARLVGLGSGPLFYGFLYFMAGMLMLHAQLIDEQGGFMLAVVITFVAIFGALFTAGRESAALRWAAYAAFVVELGFVYVQMLGSMLGTAGFFLFAGVVLAGVAWLIARFERGLHPPAPPAAALEGTS